MKTKERIKESMSENSQSTMNQVMEASGGNPGALSVCMHLLDDAGKNNNPVFWWGLIFIGVKESDLWRAFKDECQQDLPKFKAWILEEALKKQKQNIFCVED